MNIHTYIHAHTHIHTHKLLLLCFHGDFSPYIHTYIHTYRNDTFSPCLLSFYKQID